MLRVKNLGSRVFLRTGEWLEAGETKDIWAWEANFLKLVHKIEITQIKKKAK